MELKNFKLKEQKGNLGAVLLKVTQLVCVRPETRTQKL